jgi:repressor LexA
MARTTDKREKILDFIRSYTEENGFSPSVREICAAVGLRSTATVTYHLAALQEAGLIDVHGDKKRAITVTGPRSDQIPILGTVTAGLPILAVENVEGYIPWERDPSCFALRVRGDSMIGAHIEDGDLVIVRPQSTANQGDIVVALLGDEATVKRLSFDHGYPWLLPENDAYSPIDAKDAQILGKVKGVIREY